MATRSPTQTHSYWGESENTGVLPGVVAPSGTLQAGDTAYVAPSLYVCTSAAFPATWQAVGGGASSAITVSLDGTSAATVATYVGAVYLPSPITLGASSQAFLGTVGTGETVTLDLLSGVTVGATFSASITGFQAVLVTGTPALAAGWYDLVLTAGATSTAFARGLFLTV